MNGLVIVSNTNTRVNICSKKSVLSSGKARKIRCPSNLVGYKVKVESYDDVWLHEQGLHEDISIISSSMTCRIGLVLKYKRFSRHDQGLQSYNHSYSSLSGLNYLSNENFDSKTPVVREIGDALLIRFSNGHEWINPWKVNLTLMKKSLHDNDTYTNEPDKLMKNQLDETSVGSVTLKPTDDHFECGWIMFQNLDHHLLHDCGNRSVCVSSAADSVMIHNAGILSGKTKPWNDMMITTYDDARKQSMALGNVEKMEQELQKLKSKEEKLSTSFLKRKISELKHNLSRTTLDSDELITETENRVDILWKSSNFVDNFPAMLTCEYCIEIDRLIESDSKPVSKYGRESNLGIESHSTSALGSKVSSGYESRSKSGTTIRSKRSLASRSRLGSGLSYKGQHTTYNKSLVMAEYRDRFDRFLNNSERRHNDDDNNMTKPISTIPSVRCSFGCGELLAQVFQ
jgi:hypothetical protein